jgi:hypothetical protein
MTIKDIVRLAECKKWLSAKKFIIMKYNKVDFGTTEAVFNKLGGIEGIKSFLSGKTKVTKVEKNFETFDKVNVGSNNIKSLVSFIKNDASIEKESWVRSILEWPPLSHGTEEEIELVIVKPIDIGFDEMFEESATYENICNRACDYGFETCPEEVGLLLCKDHFRKNRDFFIVGSDPLKNKEGRSYLLSLWFDDSSTKMELKAYKVFNEDQKSSIFDINYKFIFCRKIVKI